MAQNVVVTSEMNYTQLFAGSPLTGTITITHDKNAAVDINSFKLGSNPLPVKFLNNVEMSDSSNLIVSIYSFEIPTQPKGLHVLPQVFVKVGNKIYKSYSRSYEVFANQGAVPGAPSVPVPNSQATNSTTASEPLWKEIPELILEAKVEGPTKLYPGQQTKFIYKYLYKGHINLTKEVIPLLDGIGLKKVGDKQNRDYVENNLNVSEFSQVFEGDTPGNYVFGPSIIEGMAYEENARGEKIYASSPLHSEAPPIAIEVQPFPASGKPSSFNGAIGTYQFKASLNSSGNFAAGEKIVLLLEMTGDPKFMSTVQAPDLNSQPGFSGMFKPSDLPPISSIVGNTKQFLVELTPLSSLIKEVPPIEFSSFDPANGKYLTIKSAPIPLNLLQKKSAPLNKAATTAPEEIQMDKAIKTPSPIEISGIDRLTSSDLHDKFLGTFWTLLLIPAFGVLLWTQKKISQEWATKTPVVKETSSQDLLRSALQAESGSPDFYRLIQKTFLQALQEQGSLHTSDIEPESLEKTGLQGDVRIFLLKLDEMRFSGNKQFNQAIISSTKELYSKIKGTSS